MAVLTAEARRRVTNELMRSGLFADAPAGVVKAAVRAMVDATDDWMEAQQAAWVAALPQPGRGATTAAQKGRIFCDVAERRAGRHRALEDG